MSVEIRARLLSISIDFLPITWYISFVVRNGGVGLLQGRRQRLDRFTRSEPVSSPLDHLKGCTTMLSFLKKETVIYLERKIEIDLWILIAICVDLFIVWVLANDPMVVVSVFYAIARTIVVLLYAIARTIVALGICIIIVRWIINISKVLNKYNCVARQVRGCNKVEWGMDEREMVATLIHIGVGVLLFILISVYSSVCGAV